MNNDARARILLLGMMNPMFNSPSILPNGFPRREYKDGTITRATTGRTSQRLPLLCVHLGALLRQLCRIGIVVVQYSGSASRLTMAMSLHVVTCWYFGSESETELCNFLSTAANCPYMAKATPKGDSRQDAQALNQCCGNEEGPDSGITSMVERQKWEC